MSPYRRRLHTHQNDNDREPGFEGVLFLVLLVALLFAHKFFVR